MSQFRQNATAAHRDQRALGGIGSWPLGPPTAKLAEPLSAIVYIRKENGAISKNAEIPDDRVSVHQVELESEETRLRRFGLPLRAQREASRSNKDRLTCVFSELHAAELADRGNADATTVLLRLNQRGLSRSAVKQDQVNTPVPSPASEHNAITMLSKQSIKKLLEASPAELRETLASALEVRAEYL